MFNFLKRITELENKDIDHEYELIDLAQRINNLGSTTMQYLTEKQTAMSQINERVTRLTKTLDIMNNVIAVQNRRLVSLESTSPDAARVQYLEICLQMAEDLVVANSAAAEYRTYLELKHAAYNRTLAQVHTERSTGIAPPIPKQEKGTSTGTNTTKEHEVPESNSKESPEVPAPQPFQELVAIDGESVGDNTTPKVPEAGAVSIPIPESLRDRVAAARKKAQESKVSSEDQN